MLKAIVLPSVLMALFVSIPVSASPWRGAFNRTKLLLKQ